MVYRADDFRSHISCEDDEKLVRRILKEYEQNGCVPATITDEDMSFFMQISRRGRMNAMQRMRLREQASIGKKYRSSLKKYYPKESKHFVSLKCVGKILDEVNKKPVYGMYSNTIIDCLHNVKHNTFGTSGLQEAAMFGVPLIIDHCYNHVMVNSELTSLSGQCSVILGYNRKSREPFDIHFSNFDSNSYFMKRFCENLNVTSVDQAMVTASGKAPHEIFPKEKLVYMSPHANDAMELFDPEAIYIIGAFVDIRQSEAISSAMVAEVAGIRSLKLPLDQFLDWGTGSKSLALNHVFRILSDLRNGVCSSLREAIEKHVPARKVKSGRNCQTKLIRKVKKIEEKERMRRQTLRVAVT